MSRAEVIARRGSIEKLIAEAKREMERAALLHGCASRERLMGAIAQLQAAIALLEEAHRIRGTETSEDARQL